MPQGTGDTLGCGLDEKLMKGLMTDVGRSRGLRESEASRCAQRWAAIPLVWVNRQQEGAVFRCLGPLEYIAQAGIVEVHICCQHYSTLMRDDCHTHRRLSFLPCFPLGEGSWKLEMMRPGSAASEVDAVQLVRSMQYSQ